MARNIITNGFGEDVNDELFDLKCRKDPLSSEFVVKKVNLSTAIAEVWEQNVITYANKMMNPLLQVGLVSFAANLTRYQLQVKQNSLVVREFVRSYIRERQAGKRHSTFSNKQDILSLFFDNKDTFTEEAMIDELVDFFLGGAQTTKMAM